MKNGSTIKLNPARLLLLRAAMKKEELRLQNTASQVARIAGSLDMEIAAKANIQAGLEKLRKQLKQDSENMSVMQRMADLVLEEFSKKDEDLADKARGLNYTSRQIAGGASSTTPFGRAVADGLHSALTSAPKTPASFLNLTSQFVADSSQNLSNLFGTVGTEIRDTLVSFAPIALLADIGRQLTSDHAGTYGGGSGGSRLEKEASAGSFDESLDAAEAKWQQELNDFLFKGETSEGWEDWEEEKSILEKIGDGLSNAGDWIGDRADDAKDWASDRVDDAKEMAEDVKDWASDTAEGVKEWASDAKEWASDAADYLKDSAIDMADDAKNYASDVWEGFQEFANSKPMEYAGNMLGDAIGGGADVASFVGNAVTGNWGEAAADGYSFINNFFNFSQDSTALFSYGVGAGAEALWPDRDISDRWYQYAEDYAGRDGLAGELHGEGFDVAGYMVDVSDWSVGLVGIINGAKKMGDALDGMSWNSIDDVKSNLFSLSGWKTVSNLDDAAELAETIEHYNNLSSNIKLGYKYVTGLFGEEGLLATAAGNTSPGKIVTGVAGSGQDFLDTMRSVLEYGDKKNSPSQQPAGTGK